MSDLVAKLEDRFSHDVAHMFLGVRIIVRIRTRVLSHYFIIFIILLNKNFLCSENFTCFQKNRLGGYLMTFDDNLKTIL